MALLRTASRSAVERGASESAVTYLRRALAESPNGPSRPDVLLRLGLLEAALDGPAGVEHLVQAYHLHEDPRRPRRDRDRCRVDPDLRQSARRGDRVRP